MGDLPQRLHQQADGEGNAFNGWYPAEAEENRVASHRIATHGTTAPIARPSTNSPANAPSCRSGDPDALARKINTNGNARPSLTPDSTFSSCRNRAGTLSLPTSAAANTGSVGARTAPISNDSIHGRPATQCANAAVITRVSGNPRCSARPGNRPPTAAPPSPPASRR